MSNKPMYKCRRTVIACCGILSCIAITYLTKADTSGAISMIVMSVAGANAAQAVFMRPAASGSEEREEPK